MIAKTIVTFSCILSLSQAVVITSNNEKNESPKEPLNAWQETIYHPPSSQAFGRKYEHYAYPKYEFEYAVSDSKTGDYKKHRESRDGDRVRGEYSLVEPDGSTRRVQYNADDFNGFNAIVSKTVNKHGDHAYSVTDHTRYFYPIGHGIKINHYFPEKKLKKSEEVTEKAVLEGETAEKAENVMLIDADKVIALKSVVNETKDSVTDNVPVISMMAVEKSSEDDKKSEAMPVKEEPIHDSESASSYYHSKVYYIGY